MNVTSNNTQEKEHLSQRNKNTETSKINIAEQSSALGSSMHRQQQDLRSAYQSRSQHRPALKRASIGINTTKQDSPTCCPQFPVQQPRNMRDREHPICEGTSTAQYNCSSPNHYLRLPHHTTYNQTNQSHQDFRFQPRWGNIEIPTSCCCSPRTRRYGHFFHCYGHIPQSSQQQQQQQPTAIRAKYPRKPSTHNQILNAHHHHSTLYKQSRMGHQYQLSSSPPYETCYYCSIDNDMYHANIKQPNAYFVSPNYGIGLRRHHVDNSMNDAQDHAYHVCKSCQKAYQMPKYSAPGGLATRDSSTMYHYKSAENTECTMNLIKGSEFLNQQYNSAEEPNSNQNFEDSSIPATHCDRIDTQIQSSPARLMSQSPIRRIARTKNVRVPKSTTSGTATPIASIDEPHYFEPVRGVYSSPPVLCSSYSSYDDDDERESANCIQPFPTARLNIPSKTPSSSCCRRIMNDSSVTTNVPTDSSFISLSHEFIRAEQMGMFAKKIIRKRFRGYSRSIYANSLNQTKRFPPNLSPMNNGMRQRAVPSRQSSTAVHAIQSDREIRNAMTCFDAEEQADEEIDEKDLNVDSQNIWNGYRWVRWITLIVLSFLLLCCLRFYRVAPGFSFDHSYLMLRQSAQDETSDAIQRDSTMADSSVSRPVTRQSTETYWHSLLELMEKVLVNSANNESRSRVDPWHDQYTDALLSALILGNRHEKLDSSDHAEPEIDSNDNQSEDLRRRLLSQIQEEKALQPLCVTEFEMIEYFTEHRSNNTLMDRGSVRSRRTSSKKSNKYDFFDQPDGSAPQLILGVSDVPNYDLFESRAESFASGFATSEYIEGSAEAMLSSCCLSSQDAVMVWRKKSRAEDVAAVSGWCFKDSEHLKSSTQYRLLPDAYCNEFCTLPYEWSIQRAGGMLNTNKNGLRSIQTNEYWNDSPISNEYACGGDPLDVLTKTESSWSIHQCSNIVNQIKEKEAIDPPEASSELTALGYAYEPTFTKTDDARTIDELFTVVNNNNDYPQRWDAWLHGVRRSDEQCSINVNLNLDLNKPRKSRSESNDAEKRLTICENKLLEYQLLPQKGAFIPEIEALHAWNIASVYGAGQCPKNPSVMIGSMSFIRHWIDRFRMQLGINHDRSTSPTDQPSTERLQSVLRRSRSPDYPPKSTHTDETTHNSMLQKYLAQRRRNILNEVL